MDTIQEKACAKLNLGLDITGKRADGYHTLSTVMHSIDLYDVLDFCKQPDGVRTYETDAPALPMDAHNLVCRAASLFCDTLQISEGFSIMLKKRIPMGAGLAGGSSDAAAVLRGLNRLFDAKQSPAALARLAEPLGADVPYCIGGGTALAEGTGERLSMLPSLPACGILLAKPAVSVSTKWAYDAVDQAGQTRHPDMKGVVEALRRQDLDAVCAKMENAFEPVIISAFPVIGEIKARMLENGAKGALMTGSGSCVFGIYTDRAAMERTEEKIKSISCEFFYKIW